MLRLRIYWLVVFVVCLLAGCFQPKYRDVGDIPFDPSQDDPSFEVCDEDNIKQYYLRGSHDEAPYYNGEKRGRNEEILRQYHYPANSLQNGYVTLRFIVNCKGDVGRIRVEEMDSNYEPILFDTLITNQLYDIVGSLDQWTPRRRNSKTYDFYQYISFQIKNGQIETILP